MSEMIQVSMVADAHATETKPVQLLTLLREIKNGRWKLRQDVIRKKREKKLRETGGDLKAAKAEIKKAKEALPAVTFAGLFSYRENDCWESPSGLLPADLDNLNSDLPAVREKLRRSPHLFFDSESVTGSGLRAVFCIPIGTRPDEDRYHACFEAVRQHVLSLCGVEIDPACKDPVRLSFVCADPTARWNLEATPIALLPAQSPKAKPAASTSRAHEPLTKEQVRDMLRFIPNRPDYADWIRVVAAVGDALPDEDAIEVLDEWSAEESPGEYAAKLRKRLKDVSVGSLIHLAKQHGWTPTPKVTVTSEPRDEEVVEVTSLTSFDLTPYPAPLSQAAFHGLAGQFVERVLPYTESDEAALLFQFLTCFGNVIGRTAHMIADAASHYCNTNMVLVGPTSIARKGTAWRHALRIFGCVDTDWTRDCIKHGVSSGEGIIFHVRDPIEKTVPVKDKGKFTGRYETVTEDPGVQEKRLMIVETEFASVLKVMERSGNTVSVVFRHMWDGDDVLSTLTKNSPIRATGAHGSVLGHITIEELRRLLTETEMANGFGNRFDWVAVHRRQELPENDELPAIADLVQRLHKSIEFAKTAGQLKRDDQARELWADVYHDLTKPKPGLFGAIIARAAPQVLRQSLHYALLDRSNLVRIEHLQAALECWRYCEESARWIFQAGTGNKNADRILAALLAAGQKGLTKTEITANVFSRNATKHEIDEALRLLHRLEMAFCKMEGTATRPAERWFFKPQNIRSIRRIRPVDEKQGDTSYSSYLLKSEKVGSALSDTPTATPTDKTDTNDSVGSGSDHQGVSEKSEAASTSTQPAKLPSVATSSVDVDSPNSQKNEAPHVTDTEAETLSPDESGVGRL